MTDQSASDSMIGAFRGLAPNRHSTSAWRDSNFLKLWIGEALSQTGSQVSIVAFPLVAVLVLHSNPSVVALLTTAQYLPILIFSLFAGSWIDRYSMRSVLLVCHLPRAVLIGCVPLAYAAGILNIQLLFAVAFAVGCFSAVGEVAFLSYTPRLVARNQIQNANVKLEWMYSIAETAGPGIGGLLVHAIGAPLAPLANAATYIAAGWLGWKIRPPQESACSSPPGTQGWRAAAADALVGLKMIWRHPVLRRLGVQSATFNLLGLVAANTLFLVFGVEILHLPVAALGWIMASASIGGFLGAGAATALGSRFGVGRTLVWTMTVGSMSLALIPVAMGPSAFAVILLATGFIVYGACMGVYNVHLLNVRVECVPTEYLGRVNGGWRLVSWGAIPLNGVLASGLALLVGTRSAIAIVVALLLLTCLTHFRSCLMSYSGGGSTAHEIATRTTPTPGEERAD
ncbi:MFS transporter [Nocardia transvalensis]|nr:MFS transporter [Nocardia transvalensis]